MTLTFAEWLQAEMERREMRQTKLAKATGLSNGRIASYLPKAIKPSEPTLNSARLICRALGCSLGSLDKAIDPPRRNEKKQGKPATKPKGRRGK